MRGTCARKASLGSALRTTKKPDGINMKNMFMHLTNYSLNKNSDKFKMAGQDFADLNSNASK